MMIKKIEVCRGEGSFSPRVESGYFLRLHLSSGPGGVVRFETGEEFTKREADCRAVLISSKYGFDRDELPTHPYREPYPKEEEGKEK
jgi:hypothetical protein